MRRERYIKNNNLKTGAIVFVAGLLIVSAFIYLFLWEKDNDVFNGDSNIPQEQGFVPEGYRLKTDIESFLILGLDKYSDEEKTESYNNDKRADFVMLLVFDNKRETCTAIQINRDTIAEVDVLGVAGQSLGTEKMQIALAHTYGNGKEVSCRNTADAVSRLLCGIRIDSYASLTMDSVAILNDLVGGVEVEVLDDFRGIDSTLKKGEIVTLMGPQALTYVRNRYGMDDSSNISRMRRQRQYLYALMDKIRERNDEDPNFLARAALQMEDTMISNKSVTQLQVLGEKYRNYEFTEFSDIPGTLVEGESFMEFYPDEEKLEELVMSVFYGIVKAK